MNVVPLQLIAPAMPQPPGATAAVALPPPIPSVLGPPSAFAELYNVPAADTHGGVYGPILAWHSLPPNQQQADKFRLRFTWHSMQPVMPSSKPTS